MTSGVVVSSDVVVVGQVGPVGRVGPGIRRGIISAIKKNANRLLRSVQNEPYTGIMHDIRSFEFAFAGLQLPLPRSISMLFGSWDLPRQV